MTLARILDLGTDPADEPDLRIRKRTAVAIVMVFMTVAVVFGLVNLASRQPVLALLAAVQFVVFGTALLLFRRTHRLAPLVTIMVVVGLGVLFLSLIPTGGLTGGSGALTWTLLVPFGAVLFLGARAGWPALAAVVVVILAAVAIDPYLPSAPQQGSTARLFFTAINLIVPAAIALGLVIFIDGERLRAKAESDALLLNILPRSIAERLKKGERVIADHYADVTVLFSDLVEFTPFTAHEPPARVIAVLNEIFSRFDTLAEGYGLEKIKTIGDAYMVVAGAPETRADHAEVMVEMALAMHAAVGSTTAAEHPFRMRVGIASGPAVAGVIGHRKFSYDVWGEAVNLASRMETTAVPGTIQIAESTWRLCGHLYAFTTRDVEAKGIGAVRTYVLDPGSIRSTPSGPDPLGS